MKSKKVISYLILSVYSFLLVHTFIPHGHHLHDFQDFICVQLLHQEDNHHDHDDSDNHSESNNASHQLPHHNESQHSQDYTLSTSSTTSQVFANSPSFFYQIPKIDLIPPIYEIEVLDIGYIPPKIPIQFSSAVPLRAPPMV